VDWGTPDPAGLATAWLLLAAAVGYDVARLVRSRRRRRQLDELLAALARDPGS
jgi:hypothetical protein